MSTLSSPREIARESGEKTYDEPIEGDRQPLELLLEEADHEVHASVLRVGQEALARGHDADNLPLDQAKHRQISSQLGPSRRSTCSAPTHIGSLANAPSIQLDISGGRKPKMRSIADRTICLAPGPIPLAAKREACRRKYDSSSM